jgi:hypothetical protein
MRGKIVASFLETATFAVLKPDTLCDPQAPVRQVTWVEIASRIGGLVKMCACQLAARFK